MKHPQQTEQMLNALGAAMAGLFLVLAVCVALIAAGSEKAW
jgi:hypothetical protein